MSLGLVERHTVFFERRIAPIDTVSFERVVHEFAALAVRSAGVPTRALRLEPAR